MRVVASGSARSGDAAAGSGAADEAAFVAGAAGVTVGAAAGIEALVADGLAAAAACVGTAVPVLGPVAGLVAGLVAVAGVGAAAEAGLLLPWPAAAGVESVAAAVPCPACGRSEGGGDAAGAGPLPAAGGAAALPLAGAFFALAAFFLAATAASPKSSAGSAHARVKQTETVRTRRIADSDAYRITEPCPHRPLFSVDKTHARPPGSAAPPRSERGVRSPPNQHKSLFNCQSVALLQNNIAVYDTDLTSLIAMDIPIHQQNSHDNKSATARSALGGAVTSPCFENNGLDSPSCGPRAQAAAG